MKNNFPGPTASAVAIPSCWLLLRVWLLLGLQSFGGGAATLFLIRRTVVERYGWISAEAFTRYWAICQIVPGINLLGLTILIGWHLAGGAGAMLSLLGLLLPSVSITILLTALYASIQDLAPVRAALRGVIPATVGLGLLLSIQMGRPLLVASWRMGRLSFWLSCVLLIGSGIVVAVVHPPVIAVLCVSGAVGAVLQKWVAQAGSNS